VGVQFPRILAFAFLLLTASVAHADHDGLAGAGRRDPTESRGLFLPGGMVDPVGTASIGATTVALPFAGEASIHVPVHDRVELFAAGEWAVRPEVGWFVLTQGGVRAQLVRSRLVAVAADLFAGPGRRFADHDDSVQDRYTTSVDVGAGLGVSACLDGARCDVVADGHATFVQDLSGPRAFAGAAGLVAGHRLRGVAAVGWSDHLALYAGARYARPHAALDLGLAWVPGEAPPIPMVAVTLRSL
jgi:hypothetical protein